MVGRLINKHALTQRRACALVALHRSTCRYPAVVRKDAQELLDRLKQLSVKYPRFGYLRLHQLLRREGWAMNHKRVYRLYKLLKLKIKLKRGRKRGLHQRTVLPPATSRHQVWSLDFVHDRLVDGLQVRILGVIDHYSRACLSLCVDTSLSGLRELRELNRLVISVW